MHVCKTSTEKGRFKMIKTIKIQMSGLSLLKINKQNSTKVVKKTCPEIAEVIEGHQNIKKEVNFLNIVPLA